MKDDRDLQLAQFPQVAEAVRKIAADNRSGASEILRISGEIFSLLEEAASKQGPYETEKSRHLVIRTCFALARAQPSMASLLNLASTVAQTALESSDHPIESASKSARDFILKTARAIDEATTKASSLIAEGAIVLTHSRSSSVVAAFKQAHNAGRNFEVIATESRPLLEGRSLARELSDENIRVTILADAAAALAVDRADIVVVGADKITADVLINKIGTRLIALAASERNCPVYAIADSSKFINANETSDEADTGRDAAELWPDAPGSIKIWNRYFEPVPLSYFTGIIFEGGLLRPEETALRVRNELSNTRLFDFFR